MSTRRTLVTDLIQEIRPKHPGLKLPDDRTTDDLVTYSKAKRAYRRELLARVRERFGLHFEEDDVPEEPEEPEETDADPE